MKYFCVYICGVRVCIHQYARVVFNVKERLQVLAASFGVDLRRGAYSHVIVCFLKLAPCAKTA